MANIEYKTDAIARYFGTNRVRWEQFYESERRVIEALELDAKTSVLDVGCGLGVMLIGAAKRDAARAKSTPIA